MNVDFQNTQADDLNVNTKSQASIHTSTGWHGEIKIIFAKPVSKTIVKSAKHSGPLRIQRAFYPEDDVCHLYLLHPPGGVVGSDSLTIDINAETNSHALITTPGSTKFYRSAGEYAQVLQRITVAKEGIAEWFPQENIFFPGAKVKLKTEINLESDANFIGWEINCFGRPVNSEKFETGQFDSLFTICRNKIPLLIERQRIFENRHLSATTGLRDYAMNAIFVCSSCDETHVALARDKISQYSTDLPIGITLLEDVLVLRILGNSTEQIQAIMIGVWQLLRPTILNKEAILPRIWLT